MTSPRPILSEMHHSLMGIRGVQNSPVHDPPGTFTKTPQDIAASWRAAGRSIVERGGEDAREPNRPSPPQFDRQ